MTQTTTKLLPCPSCGGDACVVSKKGIAGSVCKSRYYRGYAKCKKCGLQTETKKCPQEIFISWNRRL